MVTAFIFLMEFILNFSFNLLFRLFIILAIFLYLFGFRINLSSSMPIGIYYRTGGMLDRGSWVEVCLSDEIADYGIEHDFIKHGICSNGSMPIFKEVIALPGNIVHYKDDYIRVGNKEYFAPQSPKIKTWVHQNKNHLSLGYWLYGNNNPRGSWDSRYFGGVWKSQIKGVYRPVLVTGNSVR